MSNKKDAEGTLGQHRSMRSLDMVTKYVPQQTREGEDAGSDISLWRFARKRDPDMSYLLAVGTSTRMSRALTPSLVDWEGPFFCSGRRIEYLYLEGNASMPFWRLLPSDSTSDHWRASTYTGEVIVRAASEADARSIAAATFFRAYERIPGEPPLSSPWHQPTVVACQRVEHVPYDDHGPAAVVYPPS